MHDLHLRREHVAGAALGTDQLRRRGIDLDLATQAQDLHIDRAVVDLLAVQPRHLEELVARQHALGFLAQREQQVDLPIAELDALSDRVRSEARVPTLVGGYLTTPDEVNTIVGAGRADLCLIELTETDLDRQVAL